MRDIFAHFPTLCTEPSSSLFFSIISFHVAVGFLMQYNFIARRRYCHWSLPHCLPWAGLGLTLQRPLDGKSLEKELLESRKLEFFRFFWQLPFGLSVFSIPSPSFWLSDATIIVLMHCANWLTKCFSSTSPSTIFNLCCSSRALSIGRQCSL